MPGRKYEAQSGYRYGFNGKEKDKVLNSLTAYDYGFRIYNPGIGKFLSVDPLSQKYPELTPFQFASNTPIQAIDLDGLEAYFVQVAVRGAASSVPFPIPGPTVSFGVGIAFDNFGNIGVYTQKSFGATLGIGGTIGFSGGINFQARDINSLSGWGVNFGAFASVIPGITPTEVSAELNFAFESDKGNFKDVLFDKDKKTNIGMNIGIQFLPGATVGFGLYGEGSYTEFTTNINLIKFAKDAWQEIGHNLYELEKYLRTIPNLHITNDQIQGIYDAVNEKIFESNIVQPKVLENVVLPTKKEKEAQNRSQKDTSSLESE